MIAYSYNTKGNLATIINVLSKITTITVNNAGQPLTIKDPLNNTTAFTYELGDLVTVTDPLNRATVPSACPTRDFRSTRHLFVPRAS